MNNTGERIRECRIANNLTQEEVAKELGIGKQAVYKYETGAVTNIPLLNIEKMSELFHVSPGYLAGWDSSDDEQEERISVNKEEKNLLELWRNSDPTSKENVLLILNSSASKHNKKESEPSAI